MLQNISRLNVTTQTKLTCLSIASRAFLFALMKNFVLCFNTFEFELLIELELIFCGAICIFLIGLMLEIILVKY
jgi:hypothetical protein